MISTTMISIGMISTAMISTAMISTAQHGEIDIVPPGTDGADCDDPLAVVAGCREVRRRGPDVDLQSILGKALSDPAPPLNDGDRIGYCRIKIKIIKLSRRGEPVG